jgi:chemotaxis protein MotB
MRRRKKEHASGHDRWLVSYADFITLLFAFFVVLYASSKADQRKQAQIAHAIDSAFQSLGLFPSTSAKTPAGMLAYSPDQASTPVNIVTGDELAASPAVRADLERIRKQLEAQLSDQIAQHVIALHIGREGPVISLREAGFYDSGSATPHPSSRKSLDRIAEVLAVSPYDIRIEGHTDDVPIHTERFDSNWELSTARATELAKFFIFSHAFAAARLSASGYAEFHPAASNATAEGRGINRRVDIIVLPRISVLPSAPDGPPALNVPSVPATPHAGR